MSNSVHFRAYKPAVAIVFLCLFSSLLFGQTRLAVSYNPTLPPQRDLNSSLTDLMRVAPLTDHDLATVHTRGKLGWLAFWNRNGAHKAQIAAALRRNLQNAVPSLVQDTQASHGSISATFKLFNDLSVVCESLDSLLPTGASANKPEYANLSKDLSDLTRIREELSSHIQQSAALLEGKNPNLLSAAGHPKKIIIDDNVPDKPSARKHRTPQ